MKRRDVIKSFPAAALMLRAQAQTQPKKHASASPRRAGKKALTATPADLRKDRHVLAMMLLLMKRRDASSVVIFPIMEMVKTKTRAQAAQQFPVFQQVDDGVYTQVQAHLNLAAGNPMTAIKNHQQAVRSVAFDAVGDYYPDNECPFWATIDTAVAALLQ